MFIVSGDEDLLERISILEEALIEPPKIFNPSNPNNEITKMDLEFENICASLENEGIQNPKYLTVFEFNAKLQYFEKKYKKSE